MSRPKCLPSSVIFHERVAARVSLITRERCRFNAFANLATKRTPSRIAPVGNANRPLTDVVGRLISTSSSFASQKRTRNASQQSRTFSRSSSLCQRTKHVSFLPADSPALVNNSRDSRSRLFPRDHVSMHFAVF